ncbi:uncharacterized protein LOC120824872 isoform X2 [Gasterosteus aculeatus]
MGPEKRKMGPLIITLLLAVTAPTTTTEPQIQLEFKLQQNFTTELTNKSSPEFKELNDNVTTALNMVFSAEFKAAFNRTVINGFSQGSIVVDASLIFNDVTTLPNASSVVETLKTASTSGNFSLSVNASSIRAEAVVPPTQPPTTIATSLTPSNMTSAPLNMTLPAINMTSQAVNVTSPAMNMTSPPMNMTSPPMNMTSPQMNLTSPADNVTSPAVNMTSPQMNMTSPPINMTSALMNMTSPQMNMTSPAVNVTSPAVNMTSPQMNMTSPPINMTSPLMNMTSAAVSMTSPTVMVPTTTTAVITTEPKIALEFKLQENFTTKLTEKSSPEFKKLSDTVTTALNMVYQTKFGNAFNRTVINGFSQGSVVVDASLIFNDVTTLPNASSVGETLKTASTSGNFSLSVNASSIRAEAVVPPTQPPTTIATSLTPSNMTSAPLNMTLPAINMTSQAVNMTSPAMNMTSPPMNMTSPPMNMTSPQMNLTSPADNVTSPAVNMTSPQMNMTSPPINMTSALMNMTSPQMNMTSPAVNVTSPAVNMTSPQMNMTSPPINMTSPLMNMTSAAVSMTSPTVMVPTTTTAVITTEPKIALEFKLQENFTTKLTEKSSPEFKKLSDTVTTALNMVYQTKFGNAFNRTVINGFSQGSVVVDASLIFNDVTTLPNASSVGETLKTASTSGNFSLSVNASSIRAEAVVPPTQPPTTIATSLTPSNMTSAPLNMTLPAINMTSQAVNMTSPAMNMTSPPMNMTSPPMNMTSPQMNLTSPADNVTSPAVNMTSPQMNMTSPPINMTSALMNMTSPQMNMTSPAVNVTSPAVNMTSPQMNMTSPPINMTSPLMNMTSAAVSMTSPTVMVPTTTTAVITTEPKIALEFKLQENFTTKLTEKSSPEFKKLSDTVTTALNMVYQTKFGNAFNRTVINGFSQGSIVVDASLIFNNVTTLPNASSVVETLKTASTSSNFSLSVNASSIRAEAVVPATQPPTMNMTSPAMNMTSTAVNMTSPPMNMTSPPMNMTSPTMNTTSPAVNMTTMSTRSPSENATSPLVNGTSPNITTGSLATTTAPPAPDTTIQLRFSLIETFEQQLADTTSQKFKDLANRVTAALDNIYKSRFGRRFLRSLIRAFRQGSVVVESELIFANATSVPEVSAVQTTLVEAASNSSNFSLPVNVSTVVATVPTPVNATDAPTAATNATAAPTAVNLTSPGVNMTSPPMNMTSPPMNMTSPTMNMTSPAVNMTSPPMNMTSRPMNMTSAVVNMTSPQVNMTTMSTRSPSENATSPLVNGTSPNITTGSLATTTAPPAPDTTIQLRFSLIETFEQQLADTTSQKFKDLANRVTAALDNIYRSRFGRRFLRSLIRAFRQGSVVVESELIFANATSVPEVSAVQTTLVEAASNSSNFSLPVNVSTVVATVPTPVNATDAPTAATNATAAPTAVNLTSPGVNMTSPPMNMTSPPMNMTSPTMNMTSPAVNMTSPPMNMTSRPMNMTSAVVNMTSPQVNMTTMSTRSPSENATSPLVNGTSPNITTGSLATTTAPPAPDTTIQLRFSLIETFEQQLADTTSQKFKDLANRVTAALDNIYRSRFGRRFLRSLIRAFRQGSVVVESELIFANATSVPEVSAVQTTLVEAASNSSNFSLPVNVSTVVATVPTPVNATDAPTAATNATAAPTAVNLTSPGVNMTSPPMNMTSPPMNMTSPTMNMTSPAVNMTSPPMNMTSRPMNMTSAVVNMTSPQVNMTTMSTRSPSENATSPLVNGTSPNITTGSLATTTAPPAPDTTIQLRFSLIETFEQQLADTTSQKFKDLANRVTAALDNIYRSRFGRRFLRSLIRAFRQGSVVVESELIFANATSVPEVSAVQTTLVEAASNSSNFSLPVNVSTVVATVPTPVNATDAPTAATNATAAPTAVNLTSPGVNMTSPPMNMTSPPMNMTSPTMNMTSPAVNMTSPPMNMTSRPMNMTSAVVNMTSPQVNMTTMSTRSPSENATSPLVNGTSPNITTGSLATTTAPPAPDTTIQLRFSLIETFEQQLADTTSQKFKDLANRVTAALDNIYRSRFGRRFLRSLIRAFRQGSVVVESELIFANATSVPEVSAVQTTLVEAASNSSNFSLPVNVSTVVATVPTPVNATDAPTAATNATAAPTAVNLTSPGVNMTSPPMNMTSPPMNMTSPTMNMTSPAVNMTSPPMNMTSRPMNMTSAVVNMTSPQVNMTTMSTRSPSENATSPLVNGTSPNITTGSLATTTAPPAPDTTIQLRFSLIETFEQQLADTTSQKFKDLANRVTAALDNIYRSRFGRRFLRSLIRAFRQGSVVVESELIFANATSVPEVSAVQTTLVEAASNSSNFSLPVNVSTVVATVPTPVNATDAPTAATNATAAPTAVNLTSPGVNMTSPPMNMTSPPMNMTSPTMNMTSPAVNMTSPPMNMTSRPMNMTSAVVNMTSPQVNMTTMSTRSPSENATSPLVNGTSPNITTGSLATTTAPPAPDTTIQLRFSLIETFEQQLADTTSQKFKDLANRVTAALDNIYRSRFGRRFLRSLIRAFRQGSVVVESELIFANATSVPDVNDVRVTLVEAASNNSNFSLSVNVSTIVANVPIPVNVTDAPTGATNATAAPTAFNMTSPAVNMTSPAVNMTSPAVNLTSPAVNLTSPGVNMTTMSTRSPSENTTSPLVNGTSPNITTGSLATTTAAPAPDSAIQLRFSLIETFQPELADTTTQKFKDLANRVTAALDNIYRSRFGKGFLRSLIRAFRKGSVVVESELIFANATSVPEVSAVQTSLAEAASNSSNFSLPVNVSTIVANVPTPVNVTDGPTGASNATVAPTAFNMTSPGVNMTTMSTRSPSENATSPLVNGTSPNITTGSLATITDAPAPDSTIQLRFSLIQTFEPELADTTTQKFKDLANRVTTALDNIYRSRFGRRFLRSLIRAFRQGSVVVDSELIFANATSVPEVSAVQTSLAEAASNSSNFSLPVNVSTIVATVPTSVNITAAPTGVTNATAAPTAAPVATEAPASTDPPTSSEGTLRLLFSLNRTFTSDLSNRSSAAFKTLAAEVIQEINRVARIIYASSFRRTLINNFTSGSVKVDTTLVFQDKSSVPQASTATAQFISLLSNSSLGIVPGSISAQSTSTSGSPPMATMGSLAVFSLTLLAVAQMLVTL